MNRSLFSIEINNQIIHGVIDHPESTNVSLVPRAMLFLHGMGGYRTGPHDMLVNIAKEISLLGYYCIRFDFRGKGYSGNFGYESSIISMIEDTYRVLEYIRLDLNIKDISLLGMCMGAKIALTTIITSNYSFNKLIMLSSEPLRKEGIAKSVAYKQTWILIKNYVKKIISLSSWEKIIRGQINFKALFLKITEPLRQDDKKEVKNKQYKMKNSYSLKRVLLIQAGNDPETLIAVPQIEELLNRIKVCHDVIVIPGANHNFYSIRWKNLVKDIILQWI